MKPIILKRQQEINSYIFTLTMQASSHWQYIDNAMHWQCKQQVQASSASLWSLCTERPGLYPRKSYFWAFVSRLLKGQSNSHVKLNLPFSNHPFPSVKTFPVVSMIFYIASRKSGRIPGPWGFWQQLVIQSAWIHREHSLLAILGTDLKVAWAHEPLTFEQRLSDVADQLS